MSDIAFPVLVFISVFLITDPFANIPIFMSFLHQMPREERMKTIRKSHAIALIAFFLFSFFGLAIFEYLAIELFSFKIAGGLLLMVISFEMLFGIKTRTEMTPNEQQTAEEKDDLAITPLAIPLITGPGAITTGIVLFSRTRTNFQAFEFAIASIAAFALGYILFTQSDRITKIFGVIGMKIATRVMGLLLMSLAVQFVVNGVKESGIF